MAVAHCARCRKMPHELAEYRIAVEGTNRTPAQYVEREEGTYNKDTGMFWCTPCYIAMGQPPGKCNVQR